MFFIEIVWTPLPFTLHGSVMGQHHQAMCQMTYRLAHAESISSCVYLEREMNYGSHFILPLHVVYESHTSHTVTTKQHDWVQTPCLRRHALRTPGNFQSALLKKLVMSYNSLRVPPQQLGGYFEQAKEKKVCQIHMHKDDYEHPISMTSASSELAFKPKLHMHRQMGGHECMQVMYSEHDLNRD